MARVKRCGKSAPRRGNGGAGKTPRGARPNRGAFRESARPMPPGRSLEPAGNRGARGMIAAAVRGGNRIRLTFSSVRLLAMTQTHDAQQWRAAIATAVERLRPQLTGLSRDLYEHPETVAAGDALLGPASGDAARCRIHRGGGHRRNAHGFRGLARRRRQGPADRLPCRVRRAARHRPCLRPQHHRRGVARRRPGAGLDRRQLAGRGAGDRHARGRRRSEGQVHHGAGRGSSRRWTRRS